MPLPSTTPELGALDVFLSVVKLGSLSKAAAAHRVTQPSVSSRIRSLERQLGVKLLERSPTGSQPTAAGGLVAGWAGNVLRSAEELNAGVVALRARRAGTLRVSASFTLAEYLLPPLLEQFLRNRPSDSVKLEVANSEVVLERLRDGRADLGFIESPELDEDMTEHVLAFDRLVVVVGRGHPWAKVGKVPAEAVVSTPLVLREQGSGTRQAFEAALADLGGSGPTVAFEFGSTAAIRAAVVSGGPPSVLSHLAVSADLDAGSLVAIEVAGLEVDRRLRAVWPSSTELAPLAAAFVARLPTAGVDPAQPHDRP